MGEVRLPKELRSADQNLFDLRSEKIAHKSGAAARGQTPQDTEKLAPGGGGPLLESKILRKL